MARNEMTFAVGNTTAAKLTPELHDLFVNTVHVTGRVSVAAGRCAIAVSTARGWMAKGHLEEEGAYHDFVNAVEKAKAEFLLLASKRLNQFALGGRVEMPAWDKNGNPVRDHREDCAAIPGIPCGCPLVLVEKVLLPESRVLMWQMDRCDPQPSAPEDGAQFEQAERSDEERVTRGLANYALVKEALKILSELGADISTIPEARWVAELEASVLQPAVETTASAAKPIHGADGLPPEPEPAKEEVAAADTEPEPPTEPPTEPEPGRPKFEDAF